jgi:hypothetical protein
MICAILKRFCWHLTVNSAPTTKLVSPPCRGYRNSATPWSAQFVQVYKMRSSDEAVAGTGDFNGEGYLTFGAK